jgi:hypothetical protein
MEYINSNDKREVERYLEAHPKKTFYHTVFGDVNNNHMIVIWGTAIFFVFNLAFHQIRLVLDTIQLMKESRR